MNEWMYELSISLNCDFLKGIGIEILLFSGFLLFMRIKIIIKLFNDLCV